MITGKPYAEMERDRDGAKKNCEPNMDQLLYRFGTHYSDIDHHGLVIPLLASHNIHFLVLEFLIFSIVSEMQPCDCIYHSFFFISEWYYFYIYITVYFLKC